MPKKRMLSLFLLLAVMIGFPVSAQSPVCSNLSEAQRAYLRSLAVSHGQPYADYYETCLSDFHAITKQPDIIFLGDSLTFQGDWQSLSDKLTILNFGINGDRLSGLEVRLDQVVRLKPKVLFLLIGINDLTVRWRPDVYKSYEQFLQKLTTALPDTQIYIQSLLPVRDDVRTIMGNDVIQLVNQKIQSFAETYQLTYIDIFNPMLDPEDNRLCRTYQIDGLHLNQDGYAAWEQVLVPYIQALETSLCSTRTVPKKPASFRPKEKH